MAPHSLHTKPRLTRLFCAEVLGQPMAPHGSTGWGLQHCRDVWIMSCQKKSWELRIPLLPIQLVTCFLDVYFNSCMLRHVAPCYPDCLRSEVASGTRACGARCSVASWRWDERLKIFGHQIPWGLCLPIFLI